MASNRKPHPSMGDRPNAKGGSRPLDHPGCGKPAGSVNNTVMSPTRTAGGKLHPSAGKAPRVKNPPVNTYATVGGKKTPVEKGTW